MPAKDKVAAVYSSVIAGQFSVVTGAASGIGRATVELLLASGVTVLAIDVVEPPDGDVVVSHERATFERIDVRDRDAVVASIRGFAELHGRIDSLMTVAGIYGSGGPVDGFAPEEIERILDVNVLGTMWAVQGAIPYLRESRGSIVCVGSIAGRMGGVLAGIHYAASKGAVHSMVRSLAKSEVANGVRVNAVVPGPVETKMVEGRGYDVSAFPMKRWATSHELAQSIVFLASPLSSYTTGVLLDVNGGLYVG